MKSLYINTTGKNLILGFKDGDNFFSFESDGSHQQTEEIFPEIEKILNKNKISDLDFIVCLGGPGSFTGIRLGLSVVKGFVLAVNVPVIVVDNFMAGFYSIPQKESEFYVALSSGERELFTQKFACDGKVLEVGKLVKKDEFKTDVPVFLNPKFDVSAILSEIEKKFDKASYVQAPIEPTYIKPHYAKVKAK